MKSLLSILLLSVFLLTCSKEDPCEHVTCKNGGTCANGLCVCGERYKGPDCSQQVTPSKLRLTKVQVTKFPPTDANGAGWDLTSGADIYPVLSQGSTTVWVSANYFENANATTTYTFDVNPSVDLTPTTEYTIRLFDYDGNTGVDDPDYMGGYNFTAYNSTDGFPGEMTIETSTGKVSFKIYFTYVF